MNTNEKILQAAARLIQKKGIQNLTLEAVADMAGVSKGGLLYHFPSKEALISGMIVYYLDQFDNWVEKLMEEEDENNPGRWLRAFVHATCHEDAAWKDLVRSMLAAKMYHPDLRTTMQAASRSWSERAKNDGLDPAAAQVIRFAADGIWFNEVMDLEVIPHEEREAVFNRLIEMTRP